MVDTNGPDILLTLGIATEQAMKQLALAKKQFKDLKTGDGNKEAEAIVNAKRRLNLLRKQAAFNKDALMGPGGSSARKALIKENQLLAQKRMIAKKVYDPAEYKAIQAEYAKMSRTLIGKTIPASKRFAAAQNVITTNLKKQRLPFQGWALSIMFFGMAINRIVQGVWKSSTKVFQDVRHSVEGTVTGFDQLEGSIKFLGFSVGQALEPIAIMLIPIIDGISEWISEHEKLTRDLVIWGSVLGTLFSVGGAVGLAIFGFIELASKISNLDNVLKGSKTLMGGLGNALKIGVGFFFIADAFKDFTEGNIAMGIGNMLKGSGMMASVAGKGKTAGALLMIGAAIQILGTVLEKGQALTKEALANALISASGGLFFINPYAGAAVLAIGVFLKFAIDDTQFERLKTNLRVLTTSFELFMQLAMKGIAMSFDKTINKWIEKLNFMRLIQIDPINTSKVYNSKINELTRDINDLLRTSDMITSGNVGAMTMPGQYGGEGSRDNRASFTPVQTQQPINIKFEVDGEILAEKTFSLINFQTASEV